MSKKIKIIVFFLILLILIGLFFGISTIYRFFIVQDVNNSIMKNINKDNYYLKTTIKESESSSIVETYYKDGIGKQIAENGVYTWVDGKDAYIVDEENKTIYNCSLDKTIGLVSYEMFATLYPCYSNSFFQRVLYSGDLKNKIKKVVLNNEKCLMFQKKEKGTIKTVWISQNNHIIRKSKLEFSNGKVFEYDYELKFDITKSIDIELPNISDYKILDNETGETILDNSKTTRTTNIDVIKEYKK